MSAALFLTTVDVIVHAVVFVNWLLLQKINILKNNSLLYKNVQDFKAELRWKDRKVLVPSYQMSLYMQLVIVLSVYNFGQYITYDFFYIFVHTTLIYLKYKDIIQIECTNLLFFKYFRNNLQTS